MILILFRAVRDTIHQDNISIGPHGLVVDGKEVSALARSYNEFEDTNEILGSGISGMVKKVFHKGTQKTFAVKVPEFKTHSPTGHYS